MQSWIDVRSVVLDEMISLDGQGEIQANTCGSCLNRGETLYRCLECSYGLLFCGRCAVISHQALPLHRLEVRSFHTHARHAHVIYSAGRMVSLTEHLYIPSASSVISDMGVISVLWNHPLTISS